MRRFLRLLIAECAVLTAAFVGFAGAAGASATIDLIWAKTGTNELYAGDTGDSSNLTLKVILTAGPNGSQGAGVSVDYTEVLSSLSAIAFMSTPGGALPFPLGNTIDTGTRIQNISAGALPPYVGTGLAAGQSHQLGTVTFHNDPFRGGGVEIRSDANGPTDDVLDLAGNIITSTTTFNSAFIFENIVVDYYCFIDKKCSVSGGEPADACTAQSGDEVTYHYKWRAPTPADIFDDKLGYIGRSMGDGEVLTRTAALTETTTNVATYEFVGSPNCFLENFSDEVTVTVSPCSHEWPLSVVVTQAKGQSPTNNAKVTHRITGHIIDPGSLGETAHRIRVCAGSEVQSVVTDATGSATNSASGSLRCNTTGCAGFVHETEKYQSISEDGRDRDAITFIPE